MTKIDPHTYRRIVKTGVTALDKKRVCPGYILYTPLFSAGTVYLINREGEEVQRWDLPYPPGMYGYLLSNGNLFYMGRTQSETDVQVPGWQWVKGGALLEVDWQGNVVWEYYDPYHHHDARRTPSGGAVYLALERTPDEVAARGNSLSGATLF